MSKDIQEMKDYFNECIGKDTVYEEDLTISFMKIALNYIENSIPTEAIEEKIEELDKEEKEAQDSISDEEREEYSDSSIGYLLANIETRREVLQDLLENKQK